MTPTPEALAQAPIEPEDCRVPESRGLHVGYPRQGGHGVVGFDLGLERAGPVGARAAHPNTEDEGMKRLVTEDGQHPLDALIGERLTFFCLNYIYTGTLTGVTEDCVLLTDPAIVYETGPFTDPKWKDAQALPHELYVMRAGIESFGRVK
jgi:hypothetical protein